VRCRGRGKTSRLEELTELKDRLRLLYESGPGAELENHEATDVVTEEDEETSVGARIPIPAETFVEELSQKLEIHPFSVYWLLTQGIEEGGWRCMPEEQRIMANRFIATILH
jgi:hypothetical protein